MPAWMTKEGVAAPPATVAPPSIGGLNGKRAGTGGALALLRWWDFMRRVILDLVPRAHRVQFAAGRHPRLLSSAALPFPSQAPGSSLLSRRGMILVVFVCGVFRPRLFFDAPSFVSL